MTSSLRALFGDAIGLFGIAASIFARVSAARFSMSAGASVSPRDGVTTSKRIGRVRENSLKFVAYAGCTASSNAATAVKISPGAFTTTRRIDRHRDGHSRRDDRAAVAAVARGNLAIVLPLELGEELAEIGHAFAERHVLRVGAAAGSIAQIHVEQSILHARHAVAHVRAVLRPLSRIDAHAETPAPAFHRFHGLGRAVQHRHVDAELLGERVEAGEIRVAGDDDRRCAQSPGEVEDPAARRRVSRHACRRDTR